MNKKKRVGIFVDHSIVRRHFVSNGILGQLGNKYELIYVYPRNYPTRIDGDSIIVDDDTYLIDIDIERIKKLRRYGRISQIKSLRHRNGNDYIVMKRILKGILGRKLFFLGTLLSLPIIYQITTVVLFTMLGKNKALEKIVIDLELDCLLHPTVMEGLFVNDLIRIGSRYNKPVIYIMNSWDNPSTKSMAAGQPTRLVVWGKQTREHAIKYSGINPNRVVIGGAAQFHIYKQKPLVSRKEYRKILGVECNDILVCFAGSSKGLTELQYLEVLDNFKWTSDRQIKIVYKPHPWKDIDRDEKKYGRSFFDYTYQNIVLDPFSKANYKMLLEGDLFNLDLINTEDTNCLLNSIDGLLAPVSTILLESVLFGLPASVLIPDDLTENAERYSNAVGRIQVTEFIEQVGLLKCNGLNQMHQTIERIAKLSEDHAYRESVRDRAKYFVDPCREGYITRLSQIIDGALNKV